MRQDIVHRFDLNVFGLPVEKALPTGPQPTADGH
jgi:hypothetical protein